MFCFCDTQPFLVFKRRRAAHLVTRQPSVFVATHIQRVHARNAFTILFFQVRTFVFAIQRGLLEPNYRELKQCFANTVLFFTTN